MYTLVHMVQISFHSKFSTLQIFNEVRVLFAIISYTYLIVDSNLIYNTIQKSQFFKKFIQGKDENEIKKM